ncbi:hypothetical protein [Halorussus lipolyticus]|uniref:hypothetical protein n=1 Tax=Halorussus lipolyticus TaxID=3034024 RepID=UPI0023E7C20E|nr:hypothetical protein [Halorussus sp. DT80]
MASALGYYHHPDDDQFSLDFVNPDRGVIEDRLDSYDGVTETRTTTYDLDEEVHTIYTRTNEVADAEEIEYGFDRAFAEMDPDTRVLVREILELFRRIQERKHDEEGVPLDAYKEIEIRRIPRAFEQVDWSGPVPKTGGQIASNLVLCHALPNANHRTAFGVLETYLRAVDSSVKLPSMVTDDYEWQRWVDEYIVDSKRLLTIRRNIDLFRYLERYGCRTVRRKGGIDVVLSEYAFDFRQHEALRDYAHKHERRTTDFVKKLLRKMDRIDLVENPAIRKPAFAAFLRQLD